MAAGFDVSTMDDDLYIISKLDDQPNDIGGLTAEELKYEFDKGHLLIQGYINNTLIPQISDTVAVEQARAAAEAERVSNEEERVTAEAARCVWEDWDAEKAYVPGNKVSRGGSSYYCRSPNTGRVPGEDGGTYWLLIARKGDQGERGDDGLINGKNAVTLLAGDNIRITEDGDTLTFSSVGGYLVLESLAIVTPPDKTEYEASELFDTTGIVVVAYYANETITGRVTGYTVSPAGPLAAGTEKVTITYTEGGVTKSVEQPIVVHKVRVAIPTQSGTLEYNGYPQAPRWEGLDLTRVRRNETAQTNKGDYETVFSLIDPDNYEWSDGTTEDKIISWSINRISLAAPSVTDTSKTYNGSQQGPAITGYDSATMNQSGAVATNAGSYTVTHSLKDSANYQWSDGTTAAKTVNWTINQAAGSLSLNKSSITLSDSSAPTGTFTVTRAGDGAISASSSNTNVAVVSVSGTTVTVTGKTDGTATITVSVAAGTNYTAPGSASVSVTVDMVPRLGEIAVGSIVKLKENGVPVDYLVVNQGKPSNIYDESCNGTWLLRKDCAESRQWHNTRVNKYETSDIHSYLNSTYLAKYDANIQSQIKQVKIPYRQNGGRDGTDRNGANGLQCKIFLLSGYEVGFNTSNSSAFLPYDGSILSYFPESSGIEPKRVANFNGEATDWSLRSPSNSPYSDIGIANVWYVEYRGKSGSGGAIGARGVRPALVLPVGLKVAGDGSIVVV